MLNKDTAQESNIYYILMTSRKKYLYSNKKKFHRTYDISRAYRFKTRKEARNCQHLAGSLSKLILMPAGVILS